MIDDTLLLIDAKAFRVSEALAAGEHSATRSMRERVAEASEHWRDVITLIREDPQLLGSALPQHLKIDGLVILPFIPFVHFGPATEGVMGLLRASGINEILLAIAHSDTWMSRVRAGGGTGEGDNK